jgi:hypothetical protein
MAIPLIFLIISPPVVRKTHPTKNFGNGDPVEGFYHSTKGAQCASYAAST